MRGFPERFDFSRETWAGIRAAKIARAEDAFQQLVGEALREMLSGTIRVMLTTGQDGGIDAYIEDDALLPFASTKLPGPIIVQCKDNRAANNVQPAWKKEAKKIAEQGEAGWRGPYETWASARTYVYITSAVLPHQKARAALQREVEALFRRLRKERLCSVEHVVVIDWSDLRPALDADRLLADRWLGVRLSALRSHADQMEALAQRDRYLIGLEFVAPDPTNPAHPDQLLRRVFELASERRGVLLTGAGGVGKTRTLLEVAHRADASRWRVLHAIPGETLTVSALASEILSHRTDTLVVCDYFDRMPFDLVSLQQRLLPEAAQRGVKVAVLASARTERAVQSRHQARADFFDVVDLVPSTEQLRRLGEVMERGVAPHAMAALGTTRIRELTGDRPIIVLFVLQELERLASAGRVGTIDRTTVRPGNLLHWLHRRLQDDTLVVGGASPMEDEVSLSLLAATAALVMCPGDEASVRARVCDVLAHDGQVPHPERQATSFIRALLGLGWIRDTGDQLDVAHDVVTDYLLDQALHAPRQHVRQEVLSALLHPCMTSPNALACLATALGRLISVDGPFALVLGQHAQRWFEEAARSIGTALAAASTPEASLTLWRILSGPPWASAAIRCWGDVIEPWLARHGAAADSWPGLFALGVMKDLPARYAARFVDTARAWVEHHIEDEEASMLLVTLLDRGGLAPQQAVQLIELAWAWYDRHRSRESAAFVLFGVLQHVESSPDDGARVGSEVLQWCAEHPDAESGGMPLGLLITHGGVGADISEPGKLVAWSWLQRHGSTNVAGFVLGAMLGACEDDPEALPHAIDIALLWLSEHADAVQASFLFGVLLQIRSKHPSLVPAVFERAWAWFERHERLFEVNAILPGLLKAPELTPACLLRVAQVTLNWVERYGQFRQVQMFLEVLFLRNDLDPELRVQVDQAAFTWLDDHMQLPRAAIVITFLLERPTLPKDLGPRVASMALRWLHDNVGHELFWLVQATTILCEHVDTATAQRIADEVLTAAENHLEEEMGVALAFILHRADLAPTMACRASTLARRWLAAYEKSPHAFAMYSALLNRDGLDDALAARLSCTALPWLEEHGDLAHGCLILQRLLEREAQLPDAKEDVIRASLRWLERHASSFEAFGVLNALLSLSEFPPADRIATPARRWLHRYAGHRIAVALLVRLVPVHPWDQVHAQDVQYALSWSSSHGLAEEACRLLTRLAVRPDLSPNVARSVINRCMSWVDTHMRMREAAVVIYSLLCRADLTDAEVCHFIDAANCWFDVHGNIDVTGCVVAGILARRDVDPDIAVRTVQLGVQWLEKCPEELIGSIVVSLVLSHGGLQQESVRSMVKRALAFLPRVGKDRDALLLLVTLLERQHFKVRPEDRATIVRTAFEWVEQYLEFAHAHHVLRALGYARLGERDSGMLYLVMLRWLGKHGPVPGAEAITTFLLGFSSLTDRCASANVDATNALVDRVRFLLKTDAFILGCQAIPALLLMATCTDDEQTLRRARTLVSSALRDPRIGAELRTEMFAGCRRLLDANIWPHPERAWRSLSKLGLKSS